jgi:hypothetical protein
MKLLKYAAPAVAVLAAPAVAFGAVDLTAITGAGGSMETVTTDIETIGTAVIALAAVALGIRWVKATFF